MITYLEYYNKNLSPKLQNIDLFIKTEERNTIDMNTVSELLEISHSEIHEIMNENGLDSLTKHSFFVIMFHGSSDICKLFAREIKCKIPNSYSPSDISYIYEIPYDRVINAVEEASIENITTDNINELFSYIYV